MRKKFFIAVMAMATVVAANLFVISAKQGNVKCKNLLSSSLFMNKIAYASDPGNNNNQPHYAPRYVSKVSYANYANGQITEIRYTLSNTSAKARQLKSDFNLNVGATAPIKWVDVKGELDAKWGADKKSENNMMNSFSGIWAIDIRSANPYIVLCDGDGVANCIEDQDPCTTMYARAYMKFLDFYYSNN